MKKVLLITGRVLAVAILVYFVGAMGGWRVAHDVQQPEGMPWRYAEIALVYLVGSALIGLLVRRHWYIALLTLWGPILYCGTIYYYFGSPGLLLELSDFLVGLPRFRGHPHP